VEKIRLVLSQKWKGRMDLNAIDFAKTYHVLLEANEIEVSFSKAIKGYGYKLEDYEGSLFEMDIPKFSSAVIHPADAGLEIKTHWAAFADPAFGLPSAWVPDCDTDEIQSKGGTLVTPPQIIKTHIAKVANSANRQQKRFHELFWPLFNLDLSVQTSPKKLDKFVNSTLVPCVRRIEKLGYTLEESCDLFLYFLVEQFMANLPFSTRKKASLKLLETLFGSETLFDFAQKESQLPLTLQGSLFRTKAEQLSIIS
jgi:hypothetical protein